MLALEWLGFLGLILSVAIVWHEVQRRTRRHNYFWQRELLTDTAFCQAVEAAPEEGQWWTELRRGVAAQVGVPPEALYPDDRLDTLETMTCDGWDFRWLEYTLEDQLRMPVSRLVQEYPSTGECAETVRALGESLVKLLRAFERENRTG
jgi:hypothetical protein